MKCKTDPGNPQWLNIITNGMPIRVCVSLFSHQSRGKLITSLYILIQPLAHSHPPSFSGQLKFRIVEQDESLQSLMQANHAKPRRILLSLYIRVQLFLGGRT